MDKSKIPTATPGQKKEMDILQEALGVKTIQMMELAGRDIARVCTKISKGPILFFCGKGHNAGDGLCAAKFLMNWDVPVAIILVEDQKKLKTEEKRHLNTLKKLGASIFRYEIPDLQKITNAADLLVDALVGYTLNSDPRGKIKQAVEFINKQKKKVLAIDVPTGVDGLNGSHYKPCIKATHTVSLGMPLTGLVKSKNVGKLYTTDIGIPQKVYESIGIKVTPNYKRKEIIKL